MDTVVIGAGPGGLAAAATLKRRGIPVVVLERDSVGASWRRHYDRLHLHTVRWLSHLPGLRFSRSHGKWVHRDGVVRYLERYVRHHELDVRTGIEVRRIERSDPGDGCEKSGTGTSFSPERKVPIPDFSGWVLHTTDGLIHARAVIVATGYNRIPYIPDWPGRDDYEGELIHGQEYRNGNPYRGRDVLVVGSGNTGAEIALDLVERGAGHVRMAVRTPPNIVLREQYGMPTQVTGLFMRRLGPRLGDPLAALTRRFSVGDLTRFGLPEPPRGLVTQVVEDDVVPIIDVGTIEQIKLGKIEIVAALERFDGRAVVLRDGARIEPDAVIACAGYRRGLEPLVGHLGLIGPKGRPIVHGAAMAAHAPDLHFIGYSNPISGMFREFGIDARKVARVQARRRAAAGMRE